MSRLAFTKMVGSGNDFIVVDARRTHPAGRRPWPALSRSLCDRRHGIGADGLLVLERSRRADVRMRIFNPDGSEAHMCGNGARCVARYLSQAAHAKAVTIDTKAGILSADVRGDRVAMRMTTPTQLRPHMSLNVNRAPLRLGFVNTGVPHTVVSVDRLDRVDVDRLGRLVRYHSNFAPQGTNVNFVQMDRAHPNRLRIRTYERGVEGETLACGTGAAAAAVIHAARQATTNGTSASRRQVAVQVQSGETLRVSMSLRPSAGRVQVTDVILEGPARRVFDGIIELSRVRRT